MKFQFICFAFIFALFVSCVKNTELENALEMAGANRAELEKVLTHYCKSPSDSLKLRAAEFLISNMVYHHTMEHKSLPTYYIELRKANNDTSKTINLRSKFDSIGAQYAIDDNDLKIKYDIQSITADYLIKNIDQAIQHWNTNPWTQHLSFAEFCEYVLPYRLGNENLEYWRENLSTKYSPKINWLQLTDDSRNSCYWAARHLADSLKRNSLLNSGSHIYSYQKATSINLPPLVLENIKLGTCSDFAESVAFIMRACGIPVCIDFTPQWPNRSMGHTWNVLFSESGKEIPFVGADNAPGYPTNLGDIMAKVYRNTYTYQRESLFHLKKDEEIPYLFDTPYIKDVTTNYFNTVDVSLELVEKTKKRFAYLAVFDNSRWVPVQWGVISGGNKVKFNAMGKNCMYLPVLFENNECKPAGKPFYITVASKIITLNNSSPNKQVVVLKRKYPIKKGIYMLSRKIIGTTILVSNKSDFSNSIVAGSITRVPKFDWDTLHCATKTKHRYWRLIGTDKSSCYIAEFQFIYNKKNRTDTASVTAKLPSTATNKPKFLFDNDKVSFFENKQYSGDWVTIDFGKPIAVDYFRFLPRNDDNAIVAGDSYELMMWSESGWKSLIKCVAKSNQLVFKNVPSGGLYLLHNHTKGKEERIFTYENGKQVWW